MLLCLCNSNDIPLCDVACSGQVELPEQLNQFTNNATRPIAVVKETVFLLTTLRNPLHVPLELTNVRWQLPVCAPSLTFVCR